MKDKFTISTSYFIVMALYPPLKVMGQLGVVAQVCNPSHSKDRWEELWFKASPGKKFTKAQSQPMAGCRAVCLSSQLLQEAQIGGLRQASLGIKQDPISKTTKDKRISGVAQVGKHLPSK
jgi:hypothetical protein